jgi:hypothetical protein
MFTQAPYALVRLLPLSVALVLLVRPGGLAAEMLDQDGDGVSDLWQSRHSLSGVSPGDDTDGDGRSDLEEARGAAIHAIRPRLS